MLDETRDVTDTCMSGVLIDRFNGRLCILCWGLCTGKINQGLEEERTTMENKKRKWLPKMFTLAFISIAMLLWITPVNASPIHGTYAGSEFWSGMVSSSEGSIIIHSGGPGATWDTNSDLQLVWNITENGNGTWKYKYTWTGGSPDLSHLILELTNPSLATDITHLGGSGTLEEDDPITTYGTHPSNPGIPGSVYGVKFNFADDLDAYFVEFTIAQVPVWGNFYAKGANSGAYNYGFLNPDSGLYIPDTDNAFAFIVRPNGAEVPIPGAVWLLGSGLLGLVAFGRKKRIG